MTALAADLGGTRLRLALVDGARVLERVEVATDRDAGPDAWLAQMAALAAPWAGRYGRIGIAVTGLVQDGHWSALNSATLNIPPRYPLADRAEAALGQRPTLANDAQAAAWGEHLHGAGGARDMVFLTLSTGIGGGIVAGGRLMTGRQGLAGHFGQMLATEGPAERIEDTAAGLWIARTAVAAGHDTDARGVFAALPAPWAEAILDASAARFARLCHNLTLALDPEVIVIGGGIGLAPGYLERVQTHLSPAFPPNLVLAALGTDAGLIGIAALAHQP